MNHQSKIFCFRVIVIIVTALLWLLGGGMLGVAIWFRFDFWINQYVAASEELEKYAILVYIVIAAGAFIILFGIIGIIGAVRPEKTLHNIFLIVYLVFWVLVLLLLIAGGVYGYVYRKEMEDALKRSNLLKNVVQKVYGTDKKVTNGIDYMQVELKCCGGTGPLDYTESTWRYGDPYLPESRKDMAPLTCCQDYWKYKDANTVNYKYCPLFVENTANDPLKKLNYNINTKGCGEAIVDFFYNNLGAFSGVTLGMVVLSLSGIISVSCLLYYLRHWPPPQVDDVVYEMARTQEKSPYPTRSGPYANLYQS
ncbi:hypothetical protein CHS0354_034206 [Potamilus streckersoni]|uniref:Tetraspanin n=1 Tax=Potamilus streckersoni TaxID=2493646 RepID=A0AAE0T2H9_9BIVA|nr:hypothetical protein CHS0354_034206 [Potamilus streckersoni]